MLGSNSTSGQDPTQMLSNLGGASGGSTAGDAAAAGTDAAAAAGTDAAVDAGTEAAGAIGDFIPLLFA